MGKTERAEGQWVVQQATYVRLQPSDLRSPGNFYTLKVPPHTCYSQYSIKHKSLMKQQFVITHQNTILQEREKLDRSFLTEGNIIMTNCEGYNNLLFHEQNAAYLIECVL